MVCPLCLLHYPHFGLKPAAGILDNKPASAELPDSGHRPLAPFQVVSKTEAAKAREKRREL